MATYEKLKELQGGIEGWYKKKATKERTYTSLQQKELKHRDIKKSYDQRKVTEDRILAIENSIKWKQFYNWRSQLVEAKKKVRERDISLTAEKENQRTIRASLDGYLERLKQAKDQLSSLNSLSAKVRAARYINP